MWKTNYVPIFQNPSNFWLGVIPIRIKICCYNTEQMNSFLYKTFLFFFVFIEKAIKMFKEETEKNKLKVNRLY